MNAVDTNVFVYALDDDDSGKSDQGPRTDRSARATVRRDVIPKAARGRNWDVASLDTMVAIQTVAHERIPENGQRTIPDPRRTRLT
jgi:hypothetical protein